MFDDGFFGNLFDMDGDGRLDDFEKAMDLGAFIEMMSDEDEEESDEDYE